MIAHFFLTLLFVLILMGLAYFLLIASYCYGWKKIRSFNHNNYDTSVFVSVIVPARNEEQTIINCLTSLVNQNYSTHKYEIIVVDDASTDATNAIVQQFCEDNKNSILITLTEQQGGKKNAIIKAIEAAKGELIVTTDADCVMNSNWLSSIAAFYGQTQAKMIVAPVCFYDERTVFEKMQSLEFIALITSSGGSLYFNKAIMCNGANLAYTKHIFNEVNGFEGVDKQATGDDVLLMYKIKQKYPDGVHFLKHNDAIVYTKAKSTIKEFIDQRRRWASKEFKMLNTETKFVSVIVYFFNFMLLVLPLLAFFCLPNTPFRLTFFKICLIIIVIKVFIDFLLLFLGTSFFKKKMLLIYFLPEQLFYIIYIVMIGLLGMKRKYKWKDRNIN